jgi:hypothetical protein
MQAILEPVSEARCIGDGEPPSCSLYTSLDRGHGAVARLVVGP